MMNINPNILGTHGAGEAKFYPMAKNKPFTKIPKGREGDPLYHVQLPKEVIPASFKEGTTIASLEGDIIKLDEFLPLFSNPSHTKIFTGAILALVFFGMSKIPPPSDDAFNPLLHRQISAAQNHENDFMKYFLLTTAAVIFGALGVAISSLMEREDQIGIYETAAKTNSIWAQQKEIPLHSCNMKLTDKAFAQSKETHRYPNELIDPVTMELIKDPVVFLDKSGKDTTMTIFDLSTAELLINSKLDHPISKRKIYKQELVTLPELKKQITQLKDVIDPSET